MARLRSLLREAGFDSLDGYLAALITAGALCLYLLFPTRSYVLEGLARAIPMELGLAQRLLLGNYLLYGLLGNLFYHALQFLGFEGHAYVALQTMDSLIGACGLGLFYLILRAAGSGRAFSCLWTCVLGTSLGYWLWSSEAENYILSTVLLQLNFLFLLLNYKTRRISPWFLGVLQALAIFGHLVNGLFCLVALWFFTASYGERWRKAFLVYAAACAAVVAAGFGAALAALAPSNVRQACAWILGSAAGPGGQLRWHGSWWSLQGFRDWAKMTVRIFVSLSNPSYLHPPALPASSALSSVAAVLLLYIFVRGAVGFKTLWQKNRVFLVACAIWLGGYALVFTTWEPGTMVYRVSDLVPLVLVLALVSQTLAPGMRGQALVVMLTLALALGNFGAEIYPRSFWENNSSWVLMQFIKKSTEPADWVAARSGLESIYVPYFAERRPLVLANFRDHPEQLRSFLERLWGVKQKVYVTSDVLSDPYWNGIFSAYALRRHADDPAAGWTLYRVKAN